MLTEKWEARPELAEGVEKRRDFRLDVPDVHRRRPRGLHLCVLESEDASGGHPAVLRMFG